MASTRLVIGFVGVAASAALALAACSGSSTTTTNGGDGGASSGVNNGTSGGGGTAIKSCGSSQTSKCSQAELDTYGKCVQDACDSEYSKCLGADYKSGTFAGPCGTYFTCTQACACGDTACLTKCTAAKECTTCLSGISGCSKTCTVPACASGGSSGSSGSSGTSGTSGSSGGKTCDDLATCCAKIENANLKSGCDQVAGTNNDQACNSAYPSYASSCP